MNKPLILVIDDSPTIRKMVECHLSQVGYRVATAPDADRGVEAAGTIGPDLILLDHQLPGTTGDDVCRRLLASDSTSRIPVVVCSALRNRAFVSYTEFPNVVDQIPKPFTPDLLKSGVANALQTGAMVVQAQQSGSAVPETVGEVQDAALEGHASMFSVRSVIDFLNNGQHSGRLTVESDRDRIRFVLGGGRIQALYSTTIAPDAMAEHIPNDLADLAPLLAVTMGEQVDPSMTGLVRMLERSLSDPRRLRGLLRAQAAILAHRALTGTPGRFAFEPNAPLPPMFQAFPLQISLAALMIEGVRFADPTRDATDLAPLVFARRNLRGVNLDRTGLSPSDMKVYSLLDGSRSVADVAEHAGVDSETVADVARGLELIGLVERRTARSGGSILVLEDDPEAVRLIQAVLGPEGEGCQIKVVRDRVGAQLLLRRERFDLVMAAADRNGAEAFLKECKTRFPETRLVGIVGLDGEEALEGLDSMGLDGALHRPLVESDLKATVSHLMSRGEPVGAA